VADAIRLIDLMNLAVQIFFTACGLLTLLAGGIGVMNIMLVAVAERTRELAVRKAVGATNRDLMLQLLCETVVVTMVAGVVGVALGAGLIGVLQAARAHAGTAQFLTRTCASPRPTRWSRSWCSSPSASGRHRAGAPRRATRSVRRAPRRMRRRLTRVSLRI
jgi:hypothetical protein